MVNEIQSKFLNSLALVTSKIQNRQVFLASKVRRDEMSVFSEISQ